MEDKSLNKQEIYEQICTLTAALKATDIAQNMFSTAISGSAEDVKAVIDTFKQEHAELYAKCVEFGKEIDEKSIIFDVPDGESFIFDSSVIDPLSFYAMAVFGKVEEFYLFADWDMDCTSIRNYIDGIEVAGYEYLANFVANANIYDNIGEDEDFGTLEVALVSICNGECEDWF